jgi:hypothetical protein
MASIKLTNRMTRAQRREIVVMREKGASFDKISAHLKSLGIPCSYESVRLFFRRDRDAVYKTRVNEMGEALALVKQYAEKVGLTVDVNQYSITVYEAGLSQAGARLKGKSA